MSATAKAASGIAIARTAGGYDKESGKSIGFLYDALLNELPSLVLVAVALVYVASAIIGYAYIGYASGLQAWLP